MALADLPARQWMQTRGYKTDSPGSFRLFADSVVVDSFGLARIWHTSATLYRRGSTQNDDAHLLSLLIAIEGTITVRDGARELTASTNEAILLPKSPDYTIECNEPSARIEVLLDDSFSIGYSLEPDPALGQVLGASPYLKLLVAAANAALGINLVPAGIAGISLRNSFEHLTLAALRANENYQDLANIPPNERLYNRALEIIESGAGQSTLTVASIADELKLSVRQLQRVFAVAGTSPLVEIRVARARLAQQKLRSVTGSSRSDLAVVARSAGFSSTRSMREALRLVDTT
ncbi:AraC family transcriptional regulator [Agreia sp. PsM10]|uniref:AraC family transcriptional regulator n=1 Tax=Agreia sp. PsM10 TaxID=3030533 RepID=UPI00263A5F67|nr:helix-turn-helix domain-containing protein [Agreia sp. PsM10]